MIIEIFTSFSCSSTAEN